MTEFINQTNYSFDPIMYNFIEKYIHNGQQNILPTLIEIQNEINIDSAVLRDDRLIILKVNIQSPDFWEVIGSLNPLEQIREFLKDRHERKIDDHYRSRAKIRQLVIAKVINHLIDLAVTKTTDKLKNLKDNRREVIN